MKQLLYLFAGIFLISISGCDIITNDSDDNSEKLPGTFQYTNNETDFSLVFGASGNNDDELCSGMVADAQGNMYISANIYNAILITKINSDGTKGWSKIWDDNYKDYSPDSGENAETGGTANSITTDAEGYIYIVASSSDVSQNNIFSALILKINPTDGSLIWQKKWKHEGADSETVLAYSDTRAYAADASGDYLYMTGADGRNGIPVVAFNKNDGSIFFQKSLDIVYGTKDRGYTIKPDNQGNIFIGGINGSTPYLAKISNANTQNPNLEFVKKIDIGYAGRFNSADIDAQNNIYLSCDRRGVETFFSVLKLDNNADLIWGKTFPGYPEDRNNTHTVKLIGDYVYAGGRISQADLDKAFGDGLIAKFSTNDGSLLWHAIYWSGNDDEHKAEHRIKGIAECNGKLLIAGQMYTAPENYDHYSAEWIKSDYELINFMPSVTFITTATLTDYAQGKLIETNGNWSDAGVNYQLENASEKVNGSAPDGHIFIVKMNE